MRSTVGISGLQAGEDVNKLSATKPYVWDAD